MYNIPNKTSLAYDLSVFDVDKTKEEKPKPLFKPVPITASRCGSWFMLLLMLGCMVTAAAVVISSKVKLNEITADNISVSKDLEIYEKENERLNAELQSKITPAKVEEYAQNELGLQKAPNSQINRVNINTEKITEIAQHEEDDVYMRINRKLNEFLEFLGFEHNIIS